MKRETKKKKKKLLVFLVMIWLAMSIVAIGSEVKSIGYLVFGVVIIISSSIIFYKKLVD